MSSLGHLKRWLLTPEPPGVGVEFRPGEIVIARFDEGGRGVMDLCLRAPIPPGVVDFSMLRPNLVEPEPLRYYYRPLPLPDEPRFGSRLLLVVRRKPNAPRVESAIAQALRAVDPNAPYARIETLGEALDPQIRPWRLGASVFTAFGLLAAILAMVGLWSSIAYAVSQRTREFAIRKAVGAGNGSLAALILRSGLRIAAASVAIGVAIAALAAPSIADLLFQVEPRDAAVFVTVAASVLIVAALASVLPAWRVGRIAPSVALRHD